MFINVCSNSVQAMKDLNEGQITITIDEILIDLQNNRNYQQVSHGTYVRITIEDIGAGIPDRIIDKVFDPYFTTRKTGKGMGLSVVHGIVKSHNGVIEIQSEEAKGTRVEILFPKIEIKDEGAKLPKEFRYGDASILVLDDEKSIVRNIKTLLERLGYEVEGKTNPLEALELFKKNPYAFDLVITDMTMPEMDGEIFSRHILDIRSDIKIIISSGYSQKLDILKMKDIGICEYIEKPIRQRDLTMSIQKVLQGNILIEE